MMTIMAFRSVFAADVDRTTAADMAATQEPLNAAAFSEPAAVAAWRTIPSWYLVARQDKAIAPDLERYMAARAKAHTVEINSSHVAMVSHPDQVTRLIEAAAR
jgi:pimeloyl-ACP methyl ester carboxylesterase